ncbi:MAG: hypothetical protein KBA55_09540 [Ruminococcus sp.]|nr:hypothetical protein [Ruminococcus sp.]
MELIIDKKQNVIYLLKTDNSPHKYGTIGFLDLALGNFVYYFESQSDFNNYGTREAYVKMFNDTMISFYGMDIGKISINNTIFEFFDNRIEIKLTLKELDIFRIKHNIRTEIRPLEYNDFEYINGMRFLFVNTVIDVFYCLLYYYAFEGQKLKRCEHCGRWFATTSFKNKYCDRLSTVEQYSHLKCEIAAQNMRQECSRVKKRIENRERNSLKGQLSNGKNTDIIEFQKNVTNTYCTFLFQKLQIFLSIWNS